MKCFVPALFLATIATVAGAEPPAGFTPLFNGTDFSGWRGRPHFDPAREAEGTPEKRAKRQAEWDADLAVHWKVENGVIVNDGKGVFLTTNRDYADFENVNCAPDTGSWNSGTACCTGKPDGVIRTKKPLANLQGPNVCRTARRRYDLGCWKR
jgi:hypothetical protein